MGTGASSEQLGVAELPLYVAPPVSATRPGSRLPDAWRSACSAVRSSSASVGAVTAAPRARQSATPCFGRLIDLPGPALAGALPVWWAGVAGDGVATVDGHLVLWAPKLAGTTWNLPGRLRHGVWKGVPVAVDLWAHSSCFTRLTMTPQVRVATSDRYFAVGNRALDRLASELAACAGHAVRRHAGEQPVTGSSTWGASRRP